MYTKKEAQLDFFAFVEHLKPYDNIGITAPAGADGDSVGTQGSLRELLLQIYPSKKIRIINEEPCPTRYLFLEQSKYFEVSSEIIKKTKNTWPQVMICVDGGASRIGKDTTMIWDAATKLGQVDHHAIGVETKYDFLLYNPFAAATTEIVFRFAQALKLKITPSISQAIYMGLIFDTGMFKHSNTKPDTLRIGAELLESGFDHTNTAEQGMLIRTTGALNMLKSVMNNMQFELDGKYVWGVLNNTDFNSSGGDSDDREGIIDTLFLVRGCEIAAFYFEKSPGDWKISFRSRKDWNVAALAQSLNAQGGGHIRAAGCSLKGNTQEVINKCHEAVRKLMNHA